MLIEFNRVIIPTFRDQSQKQVVSLAVRLSTIVRVSPLFKTDTDASNGVVAFAPKLDDHFCEIVTENGFNFVVDEPYLSVVKRLTEMEEKIYERSLHC